MKCEICNRDFQDYTSLGSHIGQSHRDVGNKGYYDKFMKKQDEGICLNPDCGKETKFSGLTIGYPRHCSRKCSTIMLRLNKKMTNIKSPKICEFCNREFKSLVALSSHLNHPTSIHKDEVKKIKLEEEKTLILKCEICNKKYKTLKALGIHIVQFHGKGNLKSKQDYYDKYFRKDPSEGFCKMCGNLTNFVSLNYGYYTYCDTSCSKLDPEVNEKSKNTCLDKYGVDNHAKTEKERKKTSERMKNGGAAYNFTFIKNPSKPQIELFNLCKELYPSSILNFPITKFNRNIDVGIPEYKIALEYDCWYWHPDQEKDDKRQKDIESLGWKFIRYDGYIPSKKELEKDINKIKDEFIKNNEEAIKLGEYFSFLFNTPRINEIYPTRMSET